MDDETRTVRELESARTAARNNCKALLTELQIAINPITITALRVDQMIEELYGEACQYDDNGGYVSGGVKRLAFEVRVQQRLERDLRDQKDNIASQQMRSRLHVPGQPGPGGMMPGLPN